jgi:hypothetical protein
LSVVTIAFALVVAGCGEGNQAPPQQPRSEIPGNVAALGYRLNLYRDQVDILVGAVRLCELATPAYNAATCVEGSLDDFRTPAAFVVERLEELEHAGRLPARACGNVA